MAAALVVGVIATTVLHGTFQTDVTSSSLLADLRAIFFGSRGKRGQAVLHGVPLMRDYASLLQIAMVIYIVPLAFEFALRGDHLLQDMMTVGSAKVDASDLVDVRTTLDRTRQSLGSSYVLLLGVIVAAVVVVIEEKGFKRFGIYGGLHPTAVKPQLFAHFAYAHWWARPFDWGSWFWLAFAFVGVYVILLQALSVGCLLTFFWRTRHILNLGVDWLDSDGSFGWETAHRLVAVSMRLMVAYAFGLLSFAYLTQRGAYVYFPFYVGLFAIGVVQYSVAARIYSRSLDAAVRERHSEVAQKFGHLIGSAAIVGELEAVIARNEFALIARVPRSLINVRQATVFFIFVAAPAILSLWVGLEQTVGARHP